MGKNSLVKSTAKKKTAAKKGSEEKTAATGTAGVPVGQAAPKPEAGKATGTSDTTAEAPKVTVQYEPPPESKEDDPIDKLFKIGIGLVAFLFLLVIGASLANRAKYYLVPTSANLEIWQGKFAPMGKRPLIVLADVEAPTPMKPVYTEKEVFPMVFNTYIDKADALLQAPGTPDYEGIKSYVNKALPYAVSETLRRSALSRLTDIDLNTALYKANVALNRGALEALEAAAVLLDEAGRLELDTAQAERLRMKNEQVDARITALKAEQEAAQKAEEQAVSKAEEEVAAKAEQDTAQSTAEKENPKEATESH
jgi:hypothetical protein